jgi:hypothetical protein
MVLGHPPDGGFLYLVADLPQRVADAGLAEVCISTHGRKLTLTRATIVIPAPRLEPALDRDLLALAEELAARLG